MFYETSVTVQRRSSADEELYSKVKRSYTMHGPRHKGWSTRHKCKCLFVEKRPVKNSRLKKRKDKWYEGFRLCFGTYVLHEL